MPFVGLNGVHPLNHGTETPGNVPHVEHGTDQYRLWAGPLWHVYEPGWPGAFGPLLRRLHNWVDISYIYRSGRCCSFPCILPALQQPEEREERGSLPCQGRALSWSTPASMGVAFVTLWGVVFPLNSELTKGETVTVSQPFYNQVNGPLLLALIFLMGVGPSFLGVMRAWGPSGGPSSALALSRWPSWC